MLHARACLLSMIMTMKVAVVVKNVYSRQTIVDFSTIQISVYNCVTELHSHIYFSSKVQHKNYLEKFKTLLTGHSEMLHDLTDFSTSRLNGWRALFVSCVTTSVTLRRTAVKQRSRSVVIDIHWRVHDAGRRGNTGTTHQSHQCLNYSYLNNK